MIRAEKNIMLLAVLIMVVTGCSSLSKKSGPDAAPGDDSVRITVEQGLNLIGEGDEEGGLKILKTLDSAVGYFFIGSYYTSKGDDYNARLNYMESLKRDDSMVLSHNNLAIIYLDEGSIEEAEYHGKMALRNVIATLNPMVMDTYARVLTAKGEYEKAEDFFLRALSQVPVDKEVQKGVLYEGLFNLYGKWGKTEKQSEVENILIEDFEELIE